MKTITTKFHGATDTLGARISATSTSGIRVYVSYEYALSHNGPHDVAVIKLCKKLDWHGTFIIGGTDTGYVYTFNTGDTLTV